MADDIATAIALFERILAEAERKASEARSAINALYREQGLPPRYADDVGAQTATGSALLAAPTQIKRDSFYGKKQMTAIRELLEMRRAHGEGPATPREVLDALKAGGYRFATKSDDIALINVRALMRKATTVFHKLPGTNAYGLASWYPNARATKAGEGSDGGRATPAKPAAKKQQAKARKAKAKPSRNPAAQASNSAHSVFVESALADGSEWTTDRLLADAISKGIAGITKRRLQGMLLSLQRRKRVTPLGNGVWRVAGPSGTAPDDERVVPMKGFA